MMLGNLTIQNRSTNCAGKGGVKKSEVGNQIEKSGNYE